VVGRMAAPGPSSPTRLFNSSVTSRRFPALRTLTAEDVEVMVMPPAPPVSKRPADKGGSAHLFDPNLVKPSAVGSLGTAASAKTGKQPPKAALNVVPPPKRPPFRPCNPTEARTTITEAQHGYVSLHSPYDLAHRLQVLERHEARKHVLGGPYNPNGWSKARKDIEVNYFLNSPDAETIEAERRYVQDKAHRNMVEYYRRMHQALDMARHKQSS